MFAADQTRVSTQSNARTADIDVFVVHHQAVSDGDDGTIGAMVSGSRQVSATWTVDTEGPVGNFSRSYARITSVVPEDRRPWTSASVVDDRALTVECANSSGAPYWGIDPRSFEAVARLIAYGHKAYGIPLKRSTVGDKPGVVGHRDVAGIFGGSYATACPGNLDIDALIARAAELVGQPLSGNALTPSEDEETMTPELAQALADMEARITTRAPLRRDVSTGSIFMLRDDGYIPLTGVEFENLQVDTGKYIDVSSGQMGMRLHLFGLVGRADMPDVMKTLIDYYGVQPAKVI